jgi:hypothetical protein
MRSMTHVVLRVCSESVRKSKRPTIGRSDPVTMPEEYALASCVSPNCTLMTACGFTLRSWWLPRAEDMEWTRSPGHSGWRLSFCPSFIPLFIPLFSALHLMQISHTIYMLPYAYAILTYDTAFPESGCIVGQGIDILRPTSSPLHDFRSDSCASS